jgi:hypothetical protein
VPLLALKLILAPFLIGGASLAARRWGPAVAGSLVGLPLTSGPVVLFVALEQGTGFAVDVGLAVLSGGFALCAFAIADARVAAAGLAPRSAVAVASLVYLAGAIVLDLVEPGQLPILALAVGLALLLTLRLLPPSASTHRAARPPRWDLPIRIVVGTMLIVGLTTIAPILGPTASGLAATYPVYVTTLTLFAHRQGGPEAAIAMQRGLVMGLFGWLAFWVALLSMLAPGGILPAFAAAIAAALVVQAISLRLLRAAPEPGELIA